MMNFHPECVDLKALGDGTLSAMDGRRSPFQLTLLFHDIMLTFLFHDIIENRQTT